MDKGLVQRAADLVERCAVDFIDDDSGPVVTCDQYKLEQEIARLVMRELAMPVLPPIYFTADPHTWSGRSRAGNNITDMRDRL